MNDLPIISPEEKTAFAAGAMMAMQIAEVSHDQARRVLDEMKIDYDEINRVIELVRKRA